MSSRHPQEVLLAQFSLYVHKGGLNPHSLSQVTIQVNIDSPTAEVRNDTGVGDVGGGGVGGEGCGDDRGRSDVGTRELLRDAAALTTTPGPAIILTH